MDRPTRLAEFHMSGDSPRPAIVTELAAGGPVELVWRNQSGGLTFRLGDRYIKWNPRSSGIDLRREQERLDWMSAAHERTPPGTATASRHRTPQIIDAGSDADAQWMVTTALPGSHAVGDVWRARRSEAIRAIATGLRAIHAIPIADFPSDWTTQSWVGRTPESLGPRPPIDDPVIVHGDACAPNTIISSSGEWTGDVDLGDLAVGDRWADLAIASRSIDWNFGEGHQGELFDAYGIEPDEPRITYYRALCDLES